MKATELRTIRQKMELTQAELASKLGVDQRTLRRWELGEMAIPGPAVVLLRLLRTLPK